MWFYELDFSAHSSLFLVVHYNSFNNWSLIFLLLQADQGRRTLEKCWCWWLEAILCSTIWLAPYLLFILSKNASPLLKGLSFMLLEGPNFNFLFGVLYNVAAPPAPSESNGFLRVRCNGGLNQQRSAVCILFFAANIIAHSHSWVLKICSWCASQINIFLPCYPLLCCCETKREKEKIVNNCFKMCHSIFVTELEFRNPFAWPK